MCSIPGNRIRMLMVEDSPFDSELAVYEMKRYGFDVHWQRVDTESDLMKAIREEEWDVVTCDYSMPSYNGSEALQFIKERYPHVPVIIVSGEIDISLAVSLMKQGAWDYVSKAELARLPASIDRELLNARILMDRAMLEKAKKEGEELISGLMSSIPSYMAMLDREGRIRFLNRCEKTDICMIIGKPIYDIIPAAFHNPMSRAIDSVFAHGDIKRLEFQMNTEQETRWYEGTLGPLYRNDSIYGVMMSSVDISRRKRLEKALENDKKLLTGILESMIDGVYIVNKDYMVEYANSALTREFGPLTNRCCYTYFRKRSTPCPWCRNERVLDGETFEWEWTSPNNGQIYHLLETPLFHPEGSVAKLVFFHHVGLPGVNGGTAGAKGGANERQVHVQFGPRKLDEPAGSRQDRDGE